jgi:hypothetical protein
MFQFGPIGPNWNIGPERSVAAAIGYGRNWP